VEAPLLASLIAAGVSVASVLANLYIARKSRQSTLEALQIKAALDRAAESEKAIKEIEVEGERLRIRCWEMIALSQRFWSGSNSPLRGREKEYAEAADQFARQAHTFLDKWAQAKTDFPPAIVDYLRSIRHECRHRIDVIQTLSATVVNDRRALEKGRCSEFTRMLEDLLRLLDSYISAVSTVRRGLLNGTLTPEQFLSLSSPTLFDSRPSVIRDSGS
jgi:hypothetical protein